MLTQLRGQDCSSNRIGWCRYDLPARGRRVHVTRSRDWRRTLLIETDGAAGAVE